MSVYENMAFPLKMRKMSKKDIDEKVKEAAEILDLSELLKRKPKQLSGGQRQRVALGRAIVRNPKVFLMDEPLSNLDAKLRVQMRAEIKKLHQKLQTTFIYVTHDQTEALTMGDRIAVIDKGIIQQIGTPLEVYNNPVNKFVGGFLGSPSMSFINATIENNTISINNSSFELNTTQKENLKDKTEITLGIRAENFNVEDFNFQFNTKADISEILGSEQIIYFKANSSECSASLSPDFNTQNEITLKINTNKLMFFDNQTGKRIL
jgi:multiple sugar transport system ATP-binding protein